MVCGETGCSVRVGVGRDGVARSAGECGICSSLFNASLRYSVCSSGCLLLTYLPFTTLISGVYVVSGFRQEEETLTLLLSMAREAGHISKSLRTIFTFERSRCCVAFPTPSHGTIYGSGLPGPWAFGRFAFPTNLWAKGSQSLSNWEGPVESLKGSWTTKTTRKHIVQSFN
jgi:hypothetical protein